MSNHDAKRVEAAMERAGLVVSSSILTTHDDRQVLADEVTRLQKEVDDWESSWEETRSEIEMLWHKVADRDGECVLDSWAAEVMEAFDALKSRADEVTRLRNTLKEINDELCGQGFMVSGWHLNGDLEPLDSWFESNDWTEDEPPDPGGES